MKNRRSLLPVTLLALTLAGAAVIASSAPAQTTDAAAANRTRRSEREASVPSRFIITAVRLPDAQSESVRLGRSRPLPSYDAYGTLVAPDAPRFVSGSLIKQSFELYANAATTASPVFMYTQGDLRAGGSGAFQRGPYGQSYSDTQPRLSVPRYALDLHRIPPAKRMAVLTQLIGPDRARQAMDEAYAAAAITR